MRAYLYARILPALLGILLLAGCAAAPEPQITGNHHSRYQVGRPNYQIAPYQINGVWYFPKVDYSYDVTGTASWYGPGFDHQPTSDGEIYDMNQLSAAHKTLPLPSIVEVTNLQNGRVVQLRVNDRGPFVGDRLIDVSRRGAQLLGFEGGGTAPVRVRVLREESIQVAQAAMHGEYGNTAYAQAAPAVVPVAAPVPRREPRPIQVAAAGPASLRAAEVVGSPPPSPVAPTTPMAPAEPAPPRQVEVVAAPLPAPPQPAPPPPREVAAVAPHHQWPSLISQAHADTLRPTMLAAEAAAHSSARGSGRFFIQAGAFAVQENAAKVRARIATLGSVQVIPTSSRGSALYQVRLGPLSEAQAQHLLGKVVDSGYAGARIITE